jgi:hypothetical protein
MVKVAAAIERSRIRIPGRIKAPTEGTAKDSVARNKSVSIKPRIPIPTVAKPSKPTIRIGGSVVSIGFGEVAGAETGPAIEILRFQFLFVEFLGLACFLRPKVNHVAALDLNAPIPFFHDRLAV